MAETWLRPNTRALWLGAAMPVAGAALGAALAAGLWQSAWAHRAGWLLLALSLLVLTALAWQGSRPRLARQGKHLLVYLRAGRPIRLPLNVVEGFLLGQAPSMLPGKRYDRMEAAALVIKLSDRAAEWARFDVKPALGAWCNHYITIRGTWCEPLSVDLVNRLNARLANTRAEANQPEPHR